MKKTIEATVARGVIAIDGVDPALAIRVARIGLFSRDKLLVYEETKQGEDDSSVFIEGVSELTSSQVKNLEREFRTEDVSIRALFTGRIIVVIGKIGSRPTDDDLLCRSAAMP